MTNNLDSTALSTFVDRAWDQSILPTLSEFIRIPNQSPLFDPQWEQHGHMEKAIQLLAEWCRQQPIQGMKLEVARLPGRTPLLFIEIPGAQPARRTDDCVLMYGHLDKQPEFAGWKEGLGPWEPVIRDGKLYGRGGADDGYAVFSSLTAIAALQAQGIPHARCVVLIEACEESGSPDLPFHVDALAARIGTPSLVVCLDAECVDYERLWLTTSLRGNLTGALRIELLTEGVHSGMGSGISTSCFDILRQLLARLSNEINGDLLLDELYVPIPEDRRRQAAATAKVLGDAIRAKLPFVDGAQPMSNDPLELLLNSTWRPTLVVTGMDGLPNVSNAGNVLVPKIAAKLSLRLPPTCDAKQALEAVRKTLEADPPYNARVKFQADAGSSGWNAPRLAPWLETALQEASQACYGKDAMLAGTGGTIPFMGMLGEKFPATQFLVTGVLGPHSNAHGPNEFLHIDYAKRLTAAVSRIVAKQAES